MFEDSVESFVARWKPHATRAQVFAHTEGSPLLECLVGGTILQVFERTNPYGSDPGDANVILHAVTDAVRRTDEPAGLFELERISAVRVIGAITARDGDMFVVDAGFPLVVGVLPSGRSHDSDEDTVRPHELEPGDRVAFETLPPIHAFLLPRARRYGPADASSTDAI